MSNGDEGRTSTWMRHICCILHQSKRAITTRASVLLRHLWSMAQERQILEAARRRYWKSTQSRPCAHGSARKKKGKPWIQSRRENAKVLWGSGQTNYIILPDGWKLEFNNVTLIQKRSEKRSMPRTKRWWIPYWPHSFARTERSWDLLRFHQRPFWFFFKQNHHVLGRPHHRSALTKRIMKPLIQMNLGDVPLLVELRCDGLEEKARWRLGDHA